MNLQDVECVSVLGARALCGVWCVYEMNVFCCERAAINVYYLLNVFCGVCLF